MDERGSAEEQRQLIEEYGLLYEQMGGTRMAGRVSGYLLLCDPPIQSLTRIADALGVSKAAVSGAVRMLLQSGIVALVGEPGRRGDFYRALPGQMDSMLRLDHVRTLHALLDRGLASVADKDQTHSNYALMHDLLEFTAFIEAELPTLLARWRERRANPSSTEAAGAGERSPLYTGGTT